MTMIRLSIHVLLLSASLSCVFGKAEAQNAAAIGPVAVSLHVIGKGTINEFNQEAPGYFVMATVTNQQDTAIKFLIMNCSWASSNWITSNDSIHFHEPGCDGNFPIDIHLRPHQSIQFYGMLTRAGEKPFGKKVKLGFRYITDEAYYWAAARHTTVAKPPIYWSNEVEVTDNLFRFQID